MQIQSYKLYKNIVLGNIQRAGQTKPNLKSKKLGNKTLMK